MGESGHHLQTAAGSREFADGTYWIQSCRDVEFKYTSREDYPHDFEGRTVHSSRSACLIVDDQSLLFDTLSPMGTHTILSELDELLDGDDLDYLVVSHPDIPHAGNAAAIREEYPDVTLVAPKYGEGHELYHLGDAMRVGEGDAIDLGKRRVTFHEAAFLDAAVSVWMAEETTNTLFTVDWMGLAHLEGDCRTFLDELPYDEETIFELIYEFHASVMFWYEYVDPEKVDETVDHLIDRFDPDIVFSSHGLVIREDAAEYMAKVKDVVRQMQERSESLGYVDSVVEGDAQ